MEDGPTWTSHLLPAPPAAAPSAARRGSEDAEALRAASLRPRERAGLGQRPAARQPAGRHQPHSGACSPRSSRDVHRGGRPGHAAAGNKVTDRRLQSRTHGAPRSRMGRRPHGEMPWPCREIGVTPLASEERPERKGRRAGSPAAPRGQASGLAAAPAILTRGETPGPPPTPPVARSHRTAPRLPRAAPPPAPGGALPAGSGRWRAGPARRAASLSAILSGFKINSL